MVWRGSHASEGRRQIPTSGAARKIAELERKNQRLTEKLRKAAIIIEFQKKWPTSGPVRIQATARRTTDAGHHRVVLDAWESFSSGLPRNKKTNQQALLEHHVTPFLGNVRLDRVTIAHLEDFVRLMQRKTHGEQKKPYSASTINTCLHLIRTILKHAWRRRVVNDYPLREKLPLLHEPVVQNELTTEERDTFLASFDNNAGFRAHFTTTALAKRTDRKHQPPNPHSTFVTYAFERYQWSKPLFVLALYTGLRRSDLRLLKWESVDLQAGVIRLLMRKTKRPVLLPIVPKVRATLDDCRKRTVMSAYVLLTPEGKPYSESTIKRTSIVPKQSPASRDASASTTNTPSQARLPAKASTASRFATSSAA
jgi:integrase